MGPLVLLPNVEALISQFLRDQPEIEDLVPHLTDIARVYTAIPKNAAYPLLLVTQIYETKLTSAPLWIVRTQMQLSAYGGSKAQALTLGRTAEGVMAARLVDTHDLGTVVGFDGGSFLDLPDETYEPARPRFVVTFTITSHPNTTTTS